MCAYDFNYLDDAMKNLGEAFDYAANYLEVDLEEFVNLFVASKISYYYGKGNPKYISGKTGTELAMDVITSFGININFPKPQIDYNYSKEYWAGWILAYYQYKKGITFKEILNTISVKCLLSLYPTLHETSLDKSFDTIDNIITRKNDVAKLQKQRKKYGYSQRELAEKTGVNIRTLQQYELGTKDIKKASASTVLVLANALGCSIEDIM